MSCLLYYMFTVGYRASFTKHCILPVPYNVSSTKACLIPGIMVSQKSPIKWKRDIRIPFFPTII